MIGRTNSGAGSPSKMISSVAITADSTCFAMYEDVNGRWYNADTSSLPVTYNMYKGSIIVAQHYRGGGFLYTGMTKLAQNNLTAIFQIDDINCTLEIYGN